MVYVKSFLAGLAASLAFAIDKPIPRAHRAVTVCVSQGPGVFGLENAEAFATEKQSAEELFTC